MTIRNNGVAIDWLGYACARVEGPEGTVIYTDPGRYGTLDGTWADQYGGVPHPSGPAYDRQDGDVVVVTHDHHYDSDGVRRVAAEDATVLVYEEVDAERIAEKEGRDVEAPESLPHDVSRVSTDQSVSVAGTEVTVWPAYNDPDGPRVSDDGEPIHPPGFGCGFEIEVDGYSLFWTGDSDVIDPYEDLEVSLLLPSISGSFTMDREEAAEWAASARPDLVVPIHYNTFEGLRADSAAFATDVAQRGIPVALDEDGLG